MKNPIHFGVGLLGDNAIHEILAHAKLAEDLGFDTCWIAEDYFCGGAFSIASACAACTERINLAIGVLNPYTRHPALSAMEAAALYEISGGRLRLGIGGSNKLWIEEQMGIPFVNVLSNIRDSIAIMRGVFRGETFSYEGDALCVKDITSRAPKCEKLPIMMGVKSEKMLRMAGQIADGVVLSVGTSVDYVKWVKEQVLAGAAEAGRELNDFKISAYLLISVDEDGRKARSRVKTKIAYYMGLHGDHVIMQKPGISSALLRQFKAGFLEGNHRTDLVTDALIDKLSVSGTPKECREKLKALADAGVTEAVMFQMPEIPVAENLMQVKKYLM